MTRGDKVIKFVERYCVTPEGAHVGKPIKLAPFQKEFIKAIYDNEAGTRRAILGIARKNGKSALIAGIMLAHICGPEAVQNSQIVSGAMSRDQAALVFNLAAKMIQLSPELSKVTRIVPSKKMIVGLARNVEYRALAADGTTAHGLSPIVAILDEVGQVKGPTTPFLEAIMTSQGAHENPLQIFISTQAASDADFLSIMIDDAERSGDPKIVCHVYAADEGSDLMDQSQWVKANPALGIFRSKKDLEEQLKQASRLPSMEAGARNLLLNQRISLDTIWLAPSPWKACSGPIDDDVFRHNSCAIGLDLSMRTDLTAAVLAAQDDDGTVHIKPFVFAPQQGLADRAQRDRAPYADWVRDGFMMAVPGSTVDYDWVAQWIRDTLDDLDIQPASICFDRWRVDLFKKACDDCGALPYTEWVPVGQGFKDMSPRLESFEAKLLAGKMRHGGHPLLNMAASNAIATMDPAGSRKLDKSKATQRIDPLVAAVMAVHQVSEGNTAFEFNVAALIA
jgi:phage terminase large subunit-like protein